MKNKKTIIIISALIILGLISGIFAYYHKKHNLNDKIETKKGDFVIKNANKGNIKIITGNVSDIQINLQGEPEDLNDVFYGTLDSRISEFSLPDNSKGITGTITVPQGVKVIDLDKPPVKKSQITSTKHQTNSNTKTNNPQTSNPTTGQTNQPSQTNTTDTSQKDNGQNQPTNTNATCGNSIVETSEQCDDGNTSSNDGCSATCLTENNTAVCGNGKIEDNEQCDDGNTSSNDGCSATCQLEGWQYSDCTVLLKQKERNVCCQTLNQNTSHISCPGTWLFDYNTRLCTWHCPDTNCAAYNSQNDKDQCCENQKINETTPLCSGGWIYNNTNSTCEYQCTDFEDDDDTVTNAEIESATNYCTSNYNNLTEQNECCDELLKHPLSIGSNPGYPDCIGKWYLNKKCTFKCATYEERIEIIKKLNEQSNN